MPFLNPDTMKALEGKYVKFASGVPRTLKLVAHTYQEPDESLGRRYENHLIEVVDMDVNKAKEFNADFRFMNALNKINNDLDLGDVILVTPTAIQVPDKKNGGMKEVNDYTITKLEASA